MLPWLSFVLSVSLLNAAILQAQTPSNPVSKADDEVVRVTTNLVQLDVVVTDKKGNHVTDLKPEDFEIFEDNRSQPITAFSYIATGVRRTSVPGAAETNGAVATGPVAPLKADEVRRTIVFVIDDLGINEPRHINLVKIGLKKFVAEQLQPGDLVAILRTASGSGALQRLTSNKAELNATIDSIHWRLWKVGMPVAVSLFRGISLKITLMSLENVITSLKDLPGRKNVVLFTGDFETLNTPRFLQNEKGRSELGKLPEPSEVEPNFDFQVDYRSIIQRLAHKSSQSSVVIDAVDVRGLVTTGLTAADTIPADSTKSLKNGQLLTDALDNRGAKILATQQSLRELAEMTGGLAVINNNDMGNGIQRITSDLQGYYLIGYRPNEETFEKKNDRAPFHTISIKLKREGLHFRTREGFFGVPDERLPPPKPKTSGEQLIASLESPFVAADVRLRLTPLFANTPQGSFLRSLIHIDARDLTFLPEQDGWYRTRFDVIASSYGENGLLSDNLSRNETIRVRGSMYANILRYGLNYNLLVPIKKPGPYQLRAAVRDLASERIGSAYQFVEVPDVKNKRLTLSGIAVSARVLDLDALSSTSGVYKAPVNNGDLAQPTPAVRRFKAGTVMDYRYFIYNAQSDREKLPELKAEIRLVRDGQVLMSQEEPPLQPGALQFDSLRLAAGGNFRLNEDLEPGQYVLQILITDPRAREKFNTAVQTIDLEIVK